jgi:hypothetical protein
MSKISFGLNQLSEINFVFEQVARRPKRAPVASFLAGLWSREGSLTKLGLHTNFLP